MTACCSASVRMTCKPRGCCSSLAQPPELTTCCAYCPPHLTAAYATAHDSAMAQCSKAPSHIELCGQPNYPRAGPALCRMGENTAHWASWSHTLPVKARAPAAAERLLRRPGVVCEPRTPSRQPRSTPRPLAVQGLAATRCPCLRQARVRDAPFLTLHASRALLPSQAGPFAARALMSQTLPYPAPCFVFSCCFPPWPPARAAQTQLSRAARPFW